MTIPKRCFFDVNDTQMTIYNLVLVYMLLLLPLQWLYHYRHESFDSLFDFHWQYSELFAID